jgi:DNA (cytosine-5)-methyltransferase 1
MREGKDGGGKGPLVSEDVSLTLATGNGQVLVQPFVKIVRSGARDEEGNLPAEQWAEREVAPTLNVMDNTGESRATVIAFSHTNGLDIQPSSTSTSTSTSKCHSSQSISTQTAVRRLTPVECERLQGFPDQWTVVNGQKDSARHKQMGNAVAVPVVEWIMKRLVETYPPHNTTKERNEEIRNATDVRL